MQIDVSKPESWAQLEAICVGLGRISYSEFSAVIAKTINCGDDYVAGAWPQFDGNRLGDGLTRGPIEQGYALINLAYDLYYGDKKS